MTRDGGIGILVVLLALMVALAGCSNSRFAISAGAATGNVVMTEGEESRRDDASFKTEILSVIPGVSSAPQKGLDIGMDLSVMTFGTGSPLKDEIDTASGEELGMILLTLAPTIFVGLTDRFFLEAGAGWATGQATGKLYTVDDGSLTYFTKRKLEEVRERVNGNIYIAQVGWRIDRTSENHFKYFYRYVPIDEINGRSYYVSIQGIAFTFLF